MLTATNLKSVFFITFIRRGGGSFIHLSWFGPLSPIPKEGNYWILHVDPDYQSALVGTPDRKYLWLLARSPQLSPPADKALVTKAQAFGFDTSQLIRPATAP